METFRGVAFPWLCDQMGHLNTSKYVEMFDVASYHLFHALAGGPLTDGFGWADVRHEIDYRREVPVGGLVVIDSAVAEVGRTSLKARHVMWDVDRREEHARLFAVTVHFDLTLRRAAPLPAHLADRARGLA